MVLKLYAKGSSTVANNGGDTLAETGSTGLFSTTIGETLTGWHDLVVESSAGTSLLESEVNMTGDPINVGVSAQVAASLGGGGGSSIVLVPLGLQIDSRIRNREVKFWQSEQGWQLTIPVKDAAGDAVNLTGKTLKFRRFNAAGVQQLEVDATGANGSASFIVPIELTNSLIDDETWRLVDVTGGMNYVYGGGPYRVKL